MKQFKKLNKIKSLCLTLMLSVTSFISAANSEQVINKADTLADKIEAIRVKYRIPAVGVTILSPEKPVQIYTLGIANKAQQTQVTQDHLFRFGSITKNSLSIISIARKWCDVSRSSNAASFC